MKKVLILFVAALLVRSAAGCAQKSKFDKLLDEKAAAEKKCVQLSSETERLKNDATDRQKMISSLQTQLKTANAKVRDLEHELAKTKSEIKALETKSGAR